MLLNPYSSSFWWCFEFHWDHFGYCSPFVCRIELDCSWFWDLQNNKTVENKTTCNDNIEVLKPAVYVQLYNYYESRAHK